MAELLGYTEDEVKNRCSPVLFHCPSELELRGLELSRLLNEGMAGFRILSEIPSREGVECREWTLVGRDQAHIPVRQAVHCIRGASGRVEGYMMMVMPTDRSWLSLNEWLREWPRVQGVGSASLRPVEWLGRSMRSPLNAIVGFASLLREHADHPQRERFLTEIVENGRRLAYMMDHVINRSQLESASSIPGEKMELGMLLSDLERVWEATGNRKAVGLSWEVRNPSFSERIMVDARRLHTLLSHYLFGISRHLPVGWIHISAAVAGDVGKRLRIFFFIGAPRGGTGWSDARLTSIAEVIEEPVLLLQQMDAEAKLYKPTRDGRVGLSIQVSVPCEAVVTEDVWEPLQPRDVNRSAEILLIHADPRVRQQLETDLRGMQVDVHWVASNDEAQQFLESHVPDLTIRSSDIELSGPFRDTVRSGKVYGLVGEDALPFHHHEHWSGVLTLPVQSQAVWRAVQRVIS